MCMRFLIYQDKLRVFKKKYNSTLCNLVNFCKITDNESVDHYIISHIYRTFVFHLYKSYKSERTRFY